MPALVNYSGGDDEFHSGACLFSMSHVDIYHPPSKRARIGTQFDFNGSYFELENQPSIEVLPDECLFEILRRLPGGKERSAAACVSKKWLMLLSSVRRSEICKSRSNNDIMVASVSDDVEMASCNEDTDGCLTRSLEGKKATDVRLAAVAVGTRGHGGLGKLSIRGSNYARGVTNVGLSAIARGCPGLKSLSLWNVPFIGDEGLLEVARECKSLEKLELCQCPSVSSYGLITIAENCPNLTSLTIESCSKIGNEGLQAIGKLCPKIQSISVKDCPLVGDRGISSLLSSTSSVLARVKLQSLNISDFSLAVIGHYGKSVTNLFLSGLRNVSEKGFWVMGNAQGLQKLVSLTIASCGGVTDVSLEALGKGCVNLKQMCLKRCCFVSDNGLVAFTKGVKSLEVLQLEECNRVSQLGIFGAIIESPTKLKSLTLVKCMGIKDMELGVDVPSSSSSLRSLYVRNCPGFGNASLVVLGKLCPQLEHVDLTGLYGITDAGVLSLVESCETGLVKVNLSGCLNLTDKSVCALARSHGETLETLNLDGCRKITDVGVVEIAKNCLFLSDLDLSKSGITDSGIAALSCAEQLHLQVLSLASCCEVSNKSLPYLMKMGKTLVGLNLHNCNSISSSTVTHLVESLWRCDILS